MDKLERMFGHLGNMSNDELRSRVRKIRADRRVTKPWAGAAKRAKKATEAAKTKAKKKIASIDLELAAKILKEMGRE